MLKQVGDPARRMNRRFVSKIIFAVVCASLLVVNSAFALITGGTGNTPLTDPGWPAGAAAIFNNPARVAWWEGPPFGGGQWHAECRGDAKTLNAVLAEFAKLEVKRKRIVVHDGVGHSFWLNPNREPAKQDAARVDWVYMVWQRSNWDQLRKLPTDLNPTDQGDADSGPPSQIGIYAGGNIKWSDVVVPKGIDVTDERLEAHGFKVADGAVLEGNSIDLETKKPLAIHVRLELVAPQPQGGYQYPVVSELKSDAAGHWVIKNAPAGWHRVVAEADGYAPRVVGYGQFDEQPVWRSFDCGLAKAIRVAGRVTDDGDRPLANVNVRLSDVAAQAGGRYESTAGYEVKTDADGRFRFDQVPQGTASVRIYKTGYCRPGLGPSFKTPKEDLDLKMIKSGQLRVTVDFKEGKRPQGYIVEIHPETGDRVGSWGGSGNIDERNQISFKDVPPGKYVLHGHPNPSGKAENTEPITIDLKGGKITDITIQAK